MEEGGRGRERWTAEDRHPERILDASHAGRSLAKAEIDIQSGAESPSIPNELAILVRGTLLGVLIHTPADGEHLTITDVSSVYCNLKGVLGKLRMGTLLMIFRFCSKAMRDSDIYSHFGNRTSSRQKEVHTRERKEGESRNENKKTHTRKR